MLYNSAAHTVPPRDARALSFCLAELSSFFAYGSNSLSTKAKNSPFVVHIRSWGEASDDVVLLAWKSYDAPRSGPKK